MSTKAWAREHRYFHRKDGSRPGRWESEPGHDEIMDAWDDPAVRRVVVRGPSQVGGKSAVMANIIGRSIHLNPTNAIVLFPTIGRAENWHKTRLENMIAASPVLRALIPNRKSRDGEQSLRHRQYPGGQLFMHGANAPADLSADTVRDVFCDEIDRYDASAGKEGDPIDLAEQRQADYGPFAKTWLSSTPTIEGLSRIDKAYDASDKRVRQLPCPHCGEFVEIAWGDVKFKDPATGEKRAELAHIECPKCEKPWTEAQRQEAIRAGRWLATAPFNGTAGFSWNAFVCPRADLVALAQRFIDATGDPEREITFANTVEVRSWRPKADAPKWEHLLARREYWPADRLPFGARMLTGAADIQKDRIEVRLWAWSVKAECWHVETRVFLGQTNRDEVWRNLDELLDETWTAPSGAAMHLERLAVDSGAFTEEVYRWAKPWRNNRRVMLVKGDHRQSVVLGVPSPTSVTFQGKKARYGVRVWPIGSDKAKEWLYRKLDLEAPAEGEAYPPGYVHLSTRCGTDEIRQLVSEELRTGKDKHGRPRPEWHLKPGARNEALDCWNYAYAAAIDLGLWRLSEADWARRAYDWDAANDADVEPDAPVPTLRDPVKPAQDDRPSWLNRNTTRRSDDLYDV